jgi:hypothetical protein
MLKREVLLSVVAVVLIAIVNPSVSSAQEFLVFSAFYEDTPGLPPETGGWNQPTAIVNGGVLVQATANGIATQPLEVDDGDCNPAYFGGVSYTLPAPVTAGVLRLEATVSFNQLTDGTFFDTTVSGTSTSISRLAIEDDGTIVDRWGVVLETYAANTPLRIRADIDMNSKTWACTIDDELDGFDNDQVVPGLQFVNDPSLINQIGAALFTLYGSFDACTGSRIVAYDDILIVTWPPLFADGFESGGTTAWTVTAP